jgi:hypothetical protein
VFRRVSLLLLCALLALLPACSVFKKRETTVKAVPIRFPKPPKALPTLVGTVFLVSPAGHFVLIECPPQTHLEPGSALKVFRDGAETATLTVGHEQRRQFVAADIVIGEPLKGDQVMF